MKKITSCKRVTIKVGSNVLTRPDGSLDVTRMSSLVDQIAALRQEGMEVILVSSGAVASGRSELKGCVETDRKLTSVEQRQLFSAVGQAKLINRYFDLFRDYGIAAGQVLTTKENFRSRIHYLTMRNCMNVMLQNGVLPIVNENDTISVTELMFTDNDELSGLIATMMDAELLIILSNIDGIFTGNPSDPDSELIREVAQGKDLTEYISTVKSGFGRGGMQTKYHIARKVAEEGIAVVIANGKRERILLDLMHQADVPSTCFIPVSGNVSSVKKWIANSEGFSKGAVYLNEGATESILGEKAASVLPVGVTRVTGDFSAGDIVKVVDCHGREIGVGKVACDSAQARELVGKRNQKALIHYDYLYLE